LDNCQHDYLICHLIQVEGQKKSLDEIKASLKQSVHVPSNFNGLGTQIQLFGAASTIFFSEDSVCTSNLNQLLTMIGRNKKSFRDQIALDKLFAAKFLFAID
jgi:TATA-box binding protein (TBP) (component of TFIID and TFIIIB)